MKRRNWNLRPFVALRKTYAHLFPQLMVRVLVLVLALLIVVCIDIGGTSRATRSTSTAHTSLTSSSSTTAQNTNTIHYDNIQETAKPGSVKVEVNLAEFSIVSSVTAFHAGTTYYFVVANRGQQVHEFLILPVKPDGSPQSPDVQYKDKLIEIEQIAPGTTMRINFTFSPSTAGKYEIACQMRGHYQAGMRLPITVAR